MSRSVEHPFAFTSGGASLVHSSTKTAVKLVRAPWRARVWHSVGAEPAV